MLLNLSYYRAALSPVSILLYTFSHITSREHTESVLQSVLSQPPFVIKYDYPIPSSICLTHISRPMSTIHENEARAHIRSVIYYENDWRAINSDKIKFYEVWLVDKSRTQNSRVDSYGKN